MRRVSSWGRLSAFPHEVIGLGDRSRIAAELARGEGLVAHARAADTGRPPADRFMTAEAETMRETLEWLQREHGGFEEYVLGHGLAAGEITTLRASMIEAP